MTEERNCKTCGLSSYNNADENGCGTRGGGGCICYSKWQPIQKAPSLQMTEEEAREILSVVFNHEIHTKQDVIDSISDLKKAGYIRKSSLVELVEEAEEMYSELMSSTNESSKKELADLCVKYRKALQALKKDHPEFGEKK